MGEMVYDNLNAMGVRIGGLPHCCNWLAPLSTTCHQFIFQTGLGFVQLITDAIPYASCLLLQFFTQELGSTAQLICKNNSIAQWQPVLLLFMKYAIKSCYLSRRESINFMGNQIACFFIWLRIVRAFPVVLMIVFVCSS